MLRNLDDVEIWNIIEKDCKPYIDMLRNCVPGHFLLRGYFYEINNMLEFSSNLENRKPKSMSLENHEKINKAFLPIFNWKIRNGVFCYGFDVLNSIPKDLGYGEFYIFFPIGEFEYVYSKEHFDLWGYITMTAIPIDKLIEDLKFYNTTFCDVMVTRKEFDYFGNEVSVKVQTYYLVNFKYRFLLSRKIWKDNCSTVADLEC